MKEALIALGIVAVLGLGYLAFAIFYIGEDPDWKVDGLPTLASAYSTVDQKVLDQNWDWEQRERYWFRSQGSQLLPYDWFLVLEQADSQEPFRSDANIDALRFIPAPISERNPDGLPIGFAQDFRTGWVGLTCAACHTSQIDINGTSLLIDGGPAMADFDRFVAELAASMRATAESPAKAGRFAAALEADGEEARQKLLAALAEQGAVLQRRVDNNTVPDHYPDGYPGYGRLDAYGEILNQVVGTDLDIPENLEPPNGPANYPFLWGAPWAHVVQWNGAGRNYIALGPLLRNTVEVAGVFGQVQLERSILGYHSDVDLKGLGRLESALCDLRAPKWPADLLGEPDADLAVAGKAHYETHCESCHKNIDEGVAYKSEMVSLEATGTDPNHATNVFERTALAGSLEGAPESVVAGNKIAAEGPARMLLRNSVVGVLLRHPIQAYKGMQLGRCEGGPDSKESDLDYAVNAVDTLEQMPLEYKARPLHGIWATAPYLHNGSVPNLAEMLVAPEDRTPVFHVGSREFDPEVVGFDMQPGPGTIAMDTTVPGIGNSNGGHRHGESLNDSQRTELLEYLKTL